MRRSPWIMLLALLLSITVVGCGGKNTTEPPSSTPSAPAAKPAAPVKIAIAQGVDAVTLDPLFTGDTATGNVQAGLFDSVLMRKPDGTVAPGLAQKMESTSPTNYKLTLRKDVKFHNGDPFTSADVKFTVETILNPATKSPRASYFNLIKAVTTPDDYTVEFTLSAPDPLFEARMCNLNIVPAKVYQAKGAAEFSRSPVGSGPYAFKSWKKDDRVELTANKNYWGVKPAFDEVTWRAIPESAARLAAVKTGEVNLITEVPPDHAKRMNDPNVKIVTQEATRVMVVGFNTTQGIGANLKFRQAVAHAINVPAIIDSLMNGYGKQSNTLLAPSIFGYSKDIKAFEFDVEKAKKLLAEAGMAGKSVEFETPTARYPMDKEIAQAIAGQLAAIGLDAKVRPLEWGIMSGNLGSQKSSPIYIMGHGNAWWDADPQMTAFFKTKGPLSTYSNPKADGLIAAGTATNDKAKREATYKELLQFLRDDAATVPLFCITDIYGISPKLSWTPRPDQQILLWEITPAK